ncbi:hypothetical protein F4805DRAFT_460904 [Annulohypoxylon moriforme]|nr:hypothetical protein F4805DRAFT_460904 [Annulohypoxylon moriforme]
MEEYVDRFEKDVEEDLAAKEKLEKRLDRPILLSLQFVYRDKLCTAAKDIALEYGLAPYAHKEAELECFPWNLHAVFGIDDKSTPEQAIPLLPTRREKTMYGPRTANLYPRYGDNDRPVDFHFLENYHYRMIERPDRTPWEPGVVWWPNIVVRLEEVYHVMSKIGEDDTMGARKFFGFLSRPYVRLQEYWILINDKKVAIPDDAETPDYWEGELGDRDAAFESQDPFVREALEIHQQMMGWDAAVRTPEDLIGVDDENILSGNQRRRLRKVAQCLRSWGIRVPVVPRVVRWAVQGEGNRNMPPTIFEVVDQLNPERSRNYLGPRTFPDITFR